MSHFTVLVVGDNPEEQLAPYQEEDGRNSDYCQFKPEYLKENFKESAEKILEENKDDDVLYSRYKEYFDEGNYTEIFQDWNGGELDEETGNWGYWRNPNAKWDWYQLGGRWKGFFKLKEGTTGEVGESGVFNNEAEEGWVDQAKKGDIDWEFIKKNNIKTRTENFIRIKREINEGKISEEGVLLLYGLKKDDTIQTYVDRGMTPVTFAVIKNGEWYQKGDMGWWGITTNEKDPADWDAEFQKLIDSVDDDTLLSVYDCHI